MSSCSSTAYIPPLGLFYECFHGENYMGTDVRYHIIHIANQFPLEGSPVLCGCDRAYHNLCRPDVQQYHPSGRGTSASCQSGKSDCRPGTYRKRLSRRKLRFPSCHAANSFGLAMYVVFLFRKRWLSVFIITWAVLNCYTRIYLGVHYPGDLIVGGIIGGFGGWLFCTIAHKIASYLQKPSRVRRNTIRQTSVTMYVGFLTVLGIIIYSTIKSW